MARIKIEFHDSRVRLRSLRLALVMAGACAAAWSANQWQLLGQMHERLDIVSQSVDRLEQHIRSPGFAQVTPEDEKVREISMAQRADPTPVFAALESAWNANVGLLSMHARPGERSLTLELEAKSLDAGMAFIDALRSAPLFKSVMLTRHQPKSADEGHPVAMSVEARLLPINPASSARPGGAGEGPAK